MARQILSPKQARSHVNLFSQMSDFTSLKEKKPQKLPLVKPKETTISILKKLHCCFENCSLHFYQKFLMHRRNCAK